MVGKRTTYTFTFGKGEDDVDIELSQDQVLDELTEIMIMDVGCLSGDAQRKAFRELIKSIGMESFMDLYEYELKDIVREEFLNED